MDPHISMGETWTIESDYHNGVVNLWRVTPTHNPRLVEVADNFGWGLLVEGRWYKAEFLYNLAEALLVSYAESVHDTLRHGLATTPIQLMESPHETPLHPVG